ncbi:MAG TPA: large conductance mechanosensitive channel protein MscL [Candidatus Thermoplasmatota archaeon]|nr:large conductance mechanosensitive channel protein MscL [Candidatus Thermoplasmatota archaeon]
MKWLREFREFAVKGNVVDLAVGIIIGAAFGAVVKSLVDDVLMPLAGLLLGGVDLSDRYWVLRGGERIPEAATVAQAREAGATVVAYGQFLNNVLTFVIVAWAVFLLVKTINRLRARHESGRTDAPENRPCPRCLSEIPRKATRCKACAADVESLPELPPAKA